MSTLETTKSTQNSTAIHTAVLITKYTDNANSKEDLKQICAMATKPNSGFKIYANTHLSEVLNKAINDNPIVFIETNDFPETVKNILPLAFPLLTDASAYVKWIGAVNKSTGSKAIYLGHEQYSSKASFFEKWCGYWANFWPKLTTGTNANIGASKAILMQKETYLILNDKGLKDAWQMAAIGEKDNNTQKINFDLAAESYVFGDGFKAFFNSFLKGLLALKNSFFSLVSTRQENTTWLDFNHSGYKRIFGIASAFLLVLMCWISFDYNVTWDEPNHNKFSKDVLKYYASFGNDTNMFNSQKAGQRDYFTNVYYGMSIDVAASAVNSVFKIENEYATRHFFNALVGFLCILFTALIVRLFSGWLPALIALLAMVCSPSFFGHCFNNPKDIPFAAGYIMALYYLIKLMRELPDAKHQTKVMLAIAIGFAISIRAGGLLLIGYLGLFVGIVWLLKRNKKVSFFTSVKPYFIPFLIVAIAGYCIGILMWPYALRQPLTGAVKALQEFEKFSYLTYYELFEGVRIFNKPWYYEPKLIMLTAPIAVLGGFALSLIFGWFKKDRLLFWAFILLIFATLFPSAYAIYKKSYVYNGWRHFIFIYPSLVALAVIGWVALVQVIKNTKAQLLILTLIGFTFLKPGIWSIVNHPYQYLYFNEIAGGVKGANGVYELDYWNQSPRAAFDWLVKNKPEILKGDRRVSSNNIQEALKTFVPEGKDVMYKWTREYEWANDDWKYAIWTTRTLSQNQILDGYWPPKGTIHEIKVDGVTIAAVVKSENNYSYLGKQYLNLKNGDSSLYFYEKAMQYNPLEEEYARGAGNSAYEKLKTDTVNPMAYFDRAINYYTKAIELRNGNYEAYAALGEMYYGKATVLPTMIDTATIALAKKQFEKALFYKENFSGSYYYLAETNALTNNFEQAAFNYYKFFEFGQDNQQIYNRFVTILKQAGYSGDEGEPYYFMHMKALEAGDKSKAENYLQYHNQVTGQ